LPVFQDFPYPGLPSFYYGAEDGWGGDLTFRPGGHMHPKELKVDTPLMVSEDGKYWLRRYFSHADKSLIEDKWNVFCFPMGCTSWSIKNFDSPNGIQCARASFYPFWRFPTKEEL